jgi:diacylglycerol kinase family enzyme
VAKVATLMHEEHPPLTIIPLGTANNIGRTLGIVGTIKEIVDGLAKGMHRKLDVGLASGRWGKTPFVEAVGVGALAEATARKHKGDVPNKLQQGRDAFRKILAKAKPRKVKITLDDRIIESEVLFAEIMNMAHVGPQLFLAPFADPGDGRLDIAILPAESREEALDWLADPDPGELPPIVLEAGRKVTLEKGSGPLRVGDAFPSDEDPDSVDVAIDHAITILVPAPPGVSADANDDKG